MSSPEIEDVEAASNTIPARVIDVGDRAGWQYCLWCGDSDVDVLIVRDEAEMAYLCTSCRRAIVGLVEGGAL